MTDNASANARASRGNSAVSAWVNESGDQGDEGTNLSDLLADLMHFADAHDLDWSEVSRRARGHYLDERDEHGKADASAFE